MFVALQAALRVGVEGLHRAMPGDDADHQQIAAGAIFLNHVALHLAHAHCRRRLAHGVVRWQRRRQ